MSILAAIDNITLDQGAAFERLYFWEDENGVAIPITGYTAALMIKPYYGGTVIDSFTHSAGLTITGAAGSVLWEMTATETAAFTFTRAKYDLELYPAGVAADAIRLVQGEIILSKNITV